jgi:hypothetical protein
MLKSERAGLVLWRGLVFLTEDLHEWLLWCSQWRRKMATYHYMEGRAPVSTLIQGVGMGRSA